MRASAGSSKARAETVAIAGAGSLAALKLGTGLATNSIGLISSAIDSLIDVLISTLNLLSIRIADSPADEGHPYGHGKVENLAGLVQAAVIAGLGAWVIYEAVRRLLLGTRPENTEWGVGVMAASMGVSWLITRHLRQVAARTDSVVLLCDSLHYATDVWTNAGVLAGLVLLWLTGATVFDPLIAIAIGVIIVRSAYLIVARSVADLMDAAIPVDEQREIERVIHRHKFVVSFHDLRTRRSGSQRQIDFSVVLCRHLPLGEAHDLVDHIEKEIERTIPRSHVVVHAEPCMPECRLTDLCVLWSKQEDLLAHDPRREDKAVVEPPGTG
ncbi:MAG TPA: cation diffusion facilitator family transporter [Methylomirabilota bacterium]|jgi:cation diffusion facilitator family transporter|nr:cation diffusion facilitator family transporter [Methylomirabilota bacterium]